MEVSAALQAAYWKSSSSKACGKPGDGFTVGQYPKHRRVMDTKREGSIGDAAGAPLRTGSEETTVPCGVY